MVLVECILGCRKSTLLPRCDPLVELSVVDCFVFAGVESALYLFVPRGATGTRESKVTV